MKDRDFEYPCILNPAEKCPTDCKLYMSSVRITIKLANDNEETPEEAVRILRSGAEELVESFRVINANMLAKADKITQCAHYPDSVIGLPSSVLGLED